MKKSTIVVLLCIFLSHAKAISTFTILPSMEISNKLNDFYMELLSDLRFNNLGNFTDDNPDSFTYRNDKVTLALNSTLGIGQLKIRKCHLQPELLLGYSRKIIRSNNGSTPNGWFSTQPIAYSELEIKRIHAGIAPRIDRTVIASNQIMSIKPQLGVTFSHLDGSIAEKNVWALRTGLGFAYHLLSGDNAINSSGILLETGFLYDYMLTNDLSYGQTYGSNANVSYDRYTNYPKDFLSFYFGIGFSLRHFISDEQLDEQ